MRILKAFLTQHRTRAADLEQALRRAALLSLIMLLGCHPYPADRLYTLSTAASVVEPKAPTAWRVSVAVAEIPKQADRSELVVEAAPHRIEILDGHRWASPLQNEFTDSFIAALAHALPQFTPLPEQADAPADLKLKLYVRAFTADREGNARMSLFWTIQRQKNGSYWVCQALVSEPFRLTSVDYLVAAHRRNVQRMALKLSESLEAAVEDKAAASLCRQPLVYS